MDDGDWNIPAFKNGDLYLNSTWEGLGAFMVETDLNLLLPGFLSIICHWAEDMIEFLFSF